MSAGTDPFASIAQPVTQVDPFAAIAHPVDEQPSAASRFGSNLLSGAGVVSNEQGKNFFVHPLDTLKAMAQAQGELGVRAKNELSNADYVRGLTHATEYLLPGLGPVLAHSGDQLESGDYAGGIGTSLGAGVNVAAGAGMSKLAPGPVASLGGAGKPATLGNIPAQALGDTQVAHADFAKGVPPTKSTPYTPEDLQNARPYLEDEHSASPIKSVTDVKDAADSAIGRIENKVSEYVRQNPTDQLSNSPLDDVKAALAKTNELKEGFTQAGLKELAPYNLDEPLTVAKADRLRRQLNAENAAFEAKNNYDQAQARVSDPAYAAREAAADSLRQGIYGRLADRGIQDVYKLRQDEGSLIAIRNAAQNQIFNGDKNVAGTGANSQSAKVIQNLVRTGGMGTGAALGAHLGGAEGATAGAIIGGGAGEAINRAMFPGNLTRDALIERSFSKPVTNGATLPEVPEKPAIRGLLNAPAIELGPSTMTNPPSPPPITYPFRGVGNATPKQIGPGATPLGPSTMTNPLSEPAAFDTSTRAARTGRLLNAPAQQLPAPGYTEPQGEPVGTPIGSKGQPSSFQAPSIPARGPDGKFTKVFSANTGPQTPGTKMGQIATVGNERWVWHGKQWDRITQ